MWYGDKYNNCVIEFQAPDGACPLSRGPVPVARCRSSRFGGPGGPPPGLLHSLSPRYETLSFVKTGLTRRAALTPAIALALNKATGYWVIIAITHFRPLLAVLPPPGGGKGFLLRPQNA